MEAQKLIARLCRRGLRPDEIARILDVSVDSILLWAKGRVRYPRTEALRQLEDLAVRLG